MLSTLSRWLAAPTAPAARRPARLGVTLLEDRLTPALYIVDASWPGDTPAKRHYNDIQSAVDAADSNGENDTIEVRAGTYSGGAWSNGINAVVHLRPQAASDANKTIALVGVGRPVITGSGATHGVNVSGNNYTVKGFAFTGGAKLSVLRNTVATEPGVSSDRRPDQTFEEGKHYGSVKNTLIQDNTFSGGGKILLRNADGFTVADNSVVGAGNGTTEMELGGQSGAGLEVESNSTDGRVTKNKVSGSLNAHNIDANGVIVGHESEGIFIDNNLIYNNQGYGIMLLPSVTDITIVHNTLYRNSNPNGLLSGGEAGNGEIAVIKADNNVIKGNILVPRPGKEAVAMSRFNQPDNQATGNVVTHNLVWDGDSTVGGNNVSNNGMVVRADPQFASTVVGHADFLKITPASPAKDRIASMPYAASGRNAQNGDFFGEPRKENGSFDIGAHELG